MSKKKRRKPNAEIIPFYDFAGYITPEEAIKKGDTRSLNELRERASINQHCENCENPVWRFGVGNLCFVCCVGSTDASEDYELRYQL